MQRIDEDWPGAPAGELEAPVAPLPGELDGTRSTSESRSLWSPPPSAWVTIVVVLVCFWSLRWFLERLPAAIGEPLALRWLRALVDHPVRTPLAFAILALGWRHASKPRDEP